LKKLTGKFLLTEMGNKKSQSNSIDLMIASTIFGLGIIVFLIYSINGPNESAETIDSLYGDGESISEIILSEGNPEDWDYNNVDKIGILTDNKIDERKLEAFYDLSINNYSFTKRSFNTLYDYYFIIDDNVSINGNNINGIGKPNFNISNIDAENIIKITRFSIYKDKPVNAYIYIFDGNGE